MIYHYGGKMYYLKESQRISKKFSKRIMVDDQIYDSYRQAAYHLKTSRATLSKYIAKGEFHGHKLTPLPPLPCEKILDDKSAEYVDNNKSKDAENPIYSREGVFF